jgi:flagellar biosynthesis regulator FlbT
MTAASHDISAQTFTANTQTSDHISIRCATYMIQMDVFNSLVEKYISVPLLFPVQIIQSKDFTTSIGTSDIVDTAMTVALQHCDASYTVFKKDINSTMCFENPAMTYQFNIDGKYYPREAYNSINDIRSVNHTLDALNVNDSDVTSIHDDLRTSLQPYSWIQTSNSEGKLTAGKRNTTGTKSNFFIGIPFCDSEDFMGGISTNGTVQIQLRGQRLTEADGALVEKEQFAQPATIFTEDAIMKIRATKPAGRPQIEITKASIEQLMGSGV